MQKLWDWSYWFERIPGAPDVRLWRVLFGVAAVLVIFSIIAALIARASSDGLTRKFWRKISVWGLSVGPVIALLGFFRYQNAFILSMRFLIALWLLIALLWALSILKFRIFVVPKRIAERIKQEEFNKYLPHKK